MGNLIAEGIQARRYVGDIASAEGERKLMREYIEAMKRKSMRVLHRAELYAKSGHASWPGIDPTITDPVSLAEEYVHVVENYEAVLMEEESRAKLVKEKVVGPGDDSREGEAVRKLAMEEEDWEAADDVSYRETLKREQVLTRDADDARKELLGESQGMRRRKGGGRTVVGSIVLQDEEFMARHQPIEVELTSNLVGLVGQLKQSILANKGKLEKDSIVLDETEEVVYKNLAGTSKQREELKTYSNSFSISWWAMLVVALVMLFIFVLLVIVLKIPI
ncbi:unnamed protein product [Chondrus crispus]|uniref:Uncharacterized protein n=1 Tax=Chondrus crispus TaxID=2769 RepID=R7QK10_CHOCR|nr:unnamed protein product [Chondrus crispus]CDF38073.1 unnamed protein product [Chondrus crispus]|eukprot:XP_005717942.1 unnamed protein product [Chondrus crispus]